MLKKLKIGLIVFLLIEAGCIRQPLNNGKGEIYSSLFKLSANVKGKSFSSLKIYINSDGNSLFSATVLLPTNSPVSGFFYDGKRFVIVDYNGKIAYIDNKEPFNLKRVIGLNLELEPFFRFFNQCYLKKKCNRREIDGFKLIINSKREIIVIGKEGRMLLKPIGKTVKGKVKTLTMAIPKGYKVVYDNR